MRWSGWGATGYKPVLSEPFRLLAEDVLGSEAVPVATVSLASVEVARSQLIYGAERNALEGAVGSSNVRDDHHTRVAHTYGRSTADLLRLRRGDALAAPDAVVFPGSHAETVAVLKVCAATGIAVVPYGGGTSAVGGLEPLRGECSSLISLDVRRLDEVVAVDELSLTATLEAGLRGPEAEFLLGQRGLILGHYPLSFPFATIGGFAATRSAGQASAGYGRFDAMVIALKVATPGGSIEVGRAASSAAGPDLRQVFLGSEGVLGVITEVKLRVARRPAARQYDGWAFPDFASGQTALRQLAQTGVGPTLVRLSDELETSLSNELPTGSLLIIGFEGTQPSVECRRSLALDVVLACGARPLIGAGERWLGRRYGGPHSRDALLDVGVMTETIETATSWSDLLPLYHAVKRALVNALGPSGKPTVWCHTSHIYSSGACLCFTAAAPVGDDPLPRWRLANDAARAVIAEHGASLSHHRGVGLDNAAWMATEIGHPGLGILRSLKRQLDPSGVLNPGKLVLVDST